jgi:hypothetical protein
MLSFRVRIQVFSENDHIVTDITFDFAFYVSICNVDDDDNIAHVELLLLLLLDADYIALPIIIFF